MKHSRVPPQITQKRREKVLSSLEGWAMILPAQPESIRNGFHTYSYRPDSNLFYLTGFEEPDAVLVLTPYLREKSHLFVRPKDPLAELWDGLRYGPEAAQKEFGLDCTYPTTALTEELPKLLKGAEGIYYRLGRNRVFDDLILEALDSVRRSLGRTGLGLLPIRDSWPFLGQFRVIKDSFEIETQKKACQITAESHKEVMRYTRPGMREKEIASYFLYQVVKRGADDPGYSPIVACGSNACILHYTELQEKLRAIDLLLVDAGAEFNYQTADVTRTFPVSGKWRPEQKEVYSLVLEVQKQMIEKVKPGVTWKELQETAINLLCEAIFELGLLSGKPEDFRETGDYKRYYPHGIGHYLGLDVHDQGLYINPLTKESRALEPGMVLTIEPGLYIPSHDSSGFAGIGVRIEDDVLVTHSGREVLTDACPKEINEIEDLIQV